MKRVILFAVFALLIISTTQSQDCDQYIIDSENEYASRDKYVSSLNLPNNNKYVYVTYEELNSDAEPGHLILNNENEILFSKKSIDYDLQMPITEVSVLLHQDHIYVIGKIIPELAGNVRLLKLSLDLELIEAQTYDLTNGHISYIQLNSMSENRIAFSYFNGVNRKFNLSRLDNWGIVWDNKQMDTETSLHQYQLDCHNDSLCYATFNYFDGLKIFRITDDFEEIYHQDNISSTRYGSDHIFSNQDFQFVAYYQETEAGFSEHRESRLLKFDHEGILLWDRELGDTNSISNTISQVMLADNKISIIGYSFAENDFDVFYQTLDSSLSPTKIIYSTNQDDIPKKMIELPNGQYAVIGFSTQTGFFSNSFALLLNESGDLLNSYIEYGGLDESESEYFDVIYNTENLGIDIIGNEYIYDRPNLEFYSFKSNVVVQNIAISNFEQANQVIIDGLGSGKNQIKWLAEDSHENVYIAGFRQMGFYEFGCHNCLLLDTPYLYKFSPSGEVLWKAFHDSTNIHFQAPPSFLSIDSEDNAWMVTEAYNQLGYLGNIVHYESDGTVAWEFEIMDNGYMIDFFLDKEDRAWILYIDIDHNQVFNSQVFLTVIDKEANILSSQNLGQSDFNDYKMKIVEDIDHPFAIVSYNNAIDNQLTFLKIENGEILWTTIVEIEVNNGFYINKVEFNQQRNELSICDPRKISIINPDNGNITNSFFHNIEETFHSFKSRNDYTIVTTQRLIKFSLNGDLISEKLLPIVDGYHYKENDDSFLLARSDGKMLYSDFDLDQFEVIEKPDCFRVDGLENLSFMSSNSFYDFGSSLMIGKNRIGMLGQLVRETIVGNPLRQYRAYVPIASLFEVDVVTSTEDLRKEEHTSIKVFPNPLKDKLLTIELLNTMPGLKNITIHNIIGERILEMDWPAGSSKIQIALPEKSQDQSGVNTLTITNGQMTVFEKLIILK